MLNKKQVSTIVLIFFVIISGIVYYFTKEKNELVIETNDFEKDNYSNKNNNIVNNTKLDNNIQSENENLEKNLEEKIEEISVYISGEIEKPDVYVLKIGSRVKDLVNIAGGFTLEADEDNINLAKKLTDEEHIHIYAVGDTNLITENNSQTINSSKTNSSGLVNINTATKEELKTLPQIGDIISEAIIKYREEKGNFNSIEDLKNVNRIGDKTFEGLKDLITIK